MKKTIMLIGVAALILCLTVGPCLSQIYYGYAGQNSAENYTSEVISYVNAMVPEGDYFVADFCQYKYAGKGSEIGIQNMINLRNSLQDSGKFFVMIYSFDARNILSLIDNFYAFNKFIEAGIVIVAARMGNEEWAKKEGHNFDWNLYQSHFTPTITELNRLGFPGKIIFPIRRPAEAGSWNESAINFINSSPQYEPDVHPYVNSAVAIVLDTIEGERKLPQELNTANSYLITKDVFYSDLYNQVADSDFYEEVVQYHRENFPGKKFWITEFGPPIGVGPISGTIGYEACFDIFLNKLQNDADVVAAVCRFNGPGSTGSITGVSKNDQVIPGRSYIKRLGYYTYAQFLRNKNAIPVQQITAPGTYNFSIHNVQRGAQDFEGFIPISEGLEITEANFECISGSNFYSSSGAVEWWATGSEKLYEISGSGYYNFIPELSYGYAHITVENSCYDTTYTVVDTFYYTVRVPAECPKRCSGFFYSFFNVKKCSGCGIMMETQEMILSNRIVTETICK